MSLLVVGSVAFDALETPFGKVDRTLGGAASYFDAEGKLTSDSTRDFPRKFVQSFAAWIEANRKR